MLNRCRLSIAEVVVSHHVVMARRRPVYRIETTAARICLRTLSNADTQLDQEWNAWRTPEWRMDSMIACTCPLVFLQAAATLFHDVKASGNAGRTTVRAAAKRPALRVKRLSSVDPIIQVTTKVVVWCRSLRINRDFRYDAERRWWRGPRWPMPYGSFRGAVREPH